MYNNNVKINIINCKDNKLKNIVKRAVEDVINEEQQPHFCEVTVKFVSKNEIHKLNLDTRGIDRPTDVLSYPNINLNAGEIVDNELVKYNSFDGKNIFLGDCAICLSVAKLQAKEYGHSVYDEVRKLIVHSILHLLGYDHIDDKDYEVMSKKEKKILGEIDG